MKLCHALPLIAFLLFSSADPIVWAGDAGFGLEEQRLLWCGVLNADPAKANTAGPREFMESGIDGKLLLDPQTSSTLKEQILDAYSFYSFPESSRRWATVATMHNASLKLLESEASPRLRIKAYRYAMMAENPYPNTVKFDFFMSPELQKRFNAEADEKVKALLSAFVADLKTSDQRLRESKWHFLEMGIPGERGTHPELRCKKKMIEDWISGFPAPVPDPLNHADYKKLLSRFIAEEEPVEQISMKLQPAAALLREGTPLQKYLTINVLFEDRIRAKDWPADCLDALEKILDNPDAAIENKRGALVYLAYSSRTERVFSIATTDKLAGFRADALQWLWFAAHETGNEDLYAKTMEAWKKETDPWVKFVTFQSFGYSPFKFGAESRLPPEEVKNRELRWRQYLDRIVDEQKKSDDVRISSCAKFLRPE